MSSSDPSSSDPSSNDPSPSDPGDPPSSDPSSSESSGPPSSGPGTGATPERPGIPDPRGHEGAPDVPLDAPVESAPADPGAGPGAADREPIPAPGAPDELRSDEDPPGPPPDASTRPDAGTAQPLAPEGGETGQRAPTPAGAPQGEERVPAVRVTTSPTGVTIPVGAGKMAAPPSEAAAGDATTPDQPDDPARASDATVTAAAEATAPTGATAAGEEIPPEASATAQSTTRPAVAGDPVPGAGPEPAAPAEATAATAEGGPDPAPEAEPEPEPVVVDEDRQPLLDVLAAHLGDGLVSTHVMPGKDMWARITRDAWVKAGQICRDVLGMRYFGFLSAIDWMPSPYGRSEDGGLAGVDTSFAPADPASFEPGVTGGDTRFQMLARLQTVGSPTIGLTLKCDVPSDDLVMPTWTKVFPGADWHERECAEMFGIDFTGHPHLVKLYLPGAFEGFPLRKDFPLLARDVKPWPGLVDVEAMPGEEPDGEGAPVEAGAEEAG